MNLCTVFQLNVLRTGEDCTFLLIWGERERKQIVASCQYPSDLDQLYENWKACYQRAYGGSMRARVEDDFSLTPSVDYRVEEAKETLLQRFEQWLGSAELLEIRKQIQNEAVRQPFQEKRRVGENNCVDLLIACKERELSKLPWEAWEIAPSDSPLTAIHISRTPLNVEHKTLLTQNIPRRGKPRILVILADATELDLNEDRKAVRLLKKVATVDAVTWESEDIKKEFIDRLLDDRGWDALIFAGHSNETALTGGKLELAPGVTLSISEIEEQLTQAKNRGLRVAIFNSCNGICIAESLIKLGLSQVVVMREKIHDTAAHQFLHQLCQRLAGYKDLQTAILETCEYFETEKYAYPSAYLIPSLFRHPSPQADLFQIEPLGLKRFWRTWKPTKWEAIAFSMVFLSSLMTPVQGELFDLRTGVQAIYRDKTGQISSTTSAPVALIAIDPESLNEANIDAYKVNPMDRSYLAKLVDKFASSNAKVVGLNYLLDQPTSEDERLAEAIRNTVNEKNTWFVFAKYADTRSVSLEVNKKISSSQWILQGDMSITYYPFWEVMLPEQQECIEDCPLAYLLALAQKLNQQLPAEDLPQPQLHSSDSFQNKVSRIANQIGSLKPIKLPLGIKPVLDFSIPPDQVYQRISAWRFLEFNRNDLEFKEIAQKVVLIAPGGYDRADDNYGVPLAIRYWRSTRSKDIYHQSFTGGEAHAYMIHHWLSQDWVMLVPPFSMVIVAAILGRGISIILYKQKRRQRQKLAVGLMGGTTAYGLLGLQVYISASVLLPWFLPSVTFWIFLVSVIRIK